jgi:hypothetical protein
VSIKYIVLHPDCINKIGGTIYAGETYDREEAKEIFHRVWGYQSGKPMVHPSVNHYVYPANHADEILSWLTEEDCFHWSGTFQKGRFSR